MEALAEPALDDRWIPLIAVGAGKAAAAFDDVGGAAETLLRQQRRRHSALRGMRGLDAFARGAGIVELRDSARIAAGQPDRLLDASLGVAAAEQQTAGGCGGAEYVAGAGALEAALEMPGLHGEADADDGLVAGDYGGQHVRPRHPGMLGRGERRRPDRDA